MRVEKLPLQRECSPWHFVQLWRVMRTPSDRMAERREECLSPPLPASDGSAVYLLSIWLTAAVCVCLVSPSSLFLADIVTYLPDSIRRRIIETMSTPGSKSLFRFGSKRDLASKNDFKCTIKLLHDSEVLENIEYTVWVISWLCSHIVVWRRYATLHHTSSYHYHLHLPAYCKLMSDGEWQWEKNLKHWFMILILFSWSSFYCIYVSKPGHHHSGNPKANFFWITFSNTLVWRKQTSLACDTQTPRMKRYAVVVGVGCDVTIMKQEM